MMLLIQVVLRVAIGLQALFNTATLLAGAKDMIPINTLFSLNILLWAAFELLTKGDK